MAQILGKKYKTVHLRRKQRQTNTTRVMSNKLRTSLICGTCWAGTLPNLCPVHGRKYRRIPRNHGVHRTTFCGTPRFDRIYASTSCHNLAVHPVQRRYIIRSLGICARQRLIGKPEEPWLRPVWYEKVCLPSHPHDRPSFNLFLFETLVSLGPPPPHHFHYPNTNVMIRGWITVCMQFPARYVYR